MADTRTLKLNLLADVAQFGQGMSQATSDTDKLTKNTQSNSKKMAKAIGAVTIAIGTMAIALGVDAVKAAADDEVSQAKFRETLKDTAGVIDKNMVGSIDNWIQKMQFATGYSDGDLRDAMGRLTRSTGDVSAAQDILQVAMDTSRGTGKDLSTVTDILAKAYDGNYTPLKKMGIKLDENTISTKDFQGVTEKLTELFGGQASTYADTYQGKLDIVNQRFGELKESAGTKLLDVLGNLLEKVNQVAMGFGGEQEFSLSNKVKGLNREMGYGEHTAGYNLGASLKDVADSFSKLFSALSSGNASDGTSTLQSFADALSKVAGALDLLSGAADKWQRVYDKLPSWNPIKAIPKAAWGAIGNVLDGARATGGPVTSGSYLVGERGPEILTLGAGSRGNVTPNSAMGGNTFILNGIVDAESARRSIEKLLQDSARRTGAVSLVGATL